MSLKIGANVRHVDGARRAVLQLNIVDFLIKNGTNVVLAHKNGNLLEVFFEDSQKKTNEIRNDKDKFKVRNEQIDDLVIQSGTNVINAENPRRNIV